LIRDSEGNLFGTTLFGGDLTCNPPYGCGVVFKLDTDGRESVLHSFSGGMDGKLPAAGLVRDSAGNLYGTTGDGEFTGSYGTVFKLTSDGHETVLYRFRGGADGGKPYGGLVLDMAGNLYGTTAYGGRNKCTSPDGFVGCGTVFRVDPGGKETALYSFAGGTDGANPDASLLRDATGNLYGTTEFGGTSGNGTVFKIDATGKETILHNFTGGSDSFPNAGLIRDSSGDLYGTATGRAPFCLNGKGDCGLVFKLDPLGNEKVLHDFTFGLDGYAPLASLLRDTAGNLYSTTYLSAGAGNVFGTVFKLDKYGHETVLHLFNRSDGTNPAAALIRDSAGNLYGTTSGDDGYGNGTVFMLTP
jgi:uncharacterized repeat protein (TIGR03803 family)